MQKQRNCSSEREWKKVREWRMLAAENFVVNRRHAEENKAEAE
jgi:hypothetical protein